MNDQGFSPDLPSSADLNAADRLLPWKEILEKGLAAHTKGAFDDAERLYRLVLEKDAEEPNALTNLGTIFLQRGDLPKGIDFIKASLDVKPAQAAALGNLGNALTTLGRFDEAAAACQQAVDLDPNNHDALNNLGNALVQLGRRDEALQAYDSALAAKPDFAVAMKNKSNLLRDLGRHSYALSLLDQAVSMPVGAEVRLARGNVLLELDRPLEALASYDRAIALEPDSAESWRNRSVALQRLKRFEEALESANRTIELNPDIADGHFIAGSVLNDLKRPGEAIPFLQRAIDLQPDYAEAHNNLGNALQEMKRWDQALASYQRAHDCRPDMAPAHGNRGFVLREMGRYEEALAAYDRAVQLDPKFLDGLNNRGIVLGELRRFDEALAAYDQAIAVDPEFTDAQWNKSLLLLLLERYAEGWPLYEWRWRRADVSAPPDTPIIEAGWLERNDVAGKTVLVRAEQGLGDSLQMLRYVPMLADLGARVAVAVQSPLGEITSTVRGVSQVIVEGDSTPTADLRLMMMSLPLVFGTLPSTIPADVPYVSAGRAERETWAARLGPKTRPRIGLAWSGSRVHKNDHVRSMSLQDLLPILDADAEFVSLQIEYREADEVLLKQLDGRIRRFDGQIKSFMDTAALIQNMDLVISVDTSVAHIAGALGKPVWLLLARTPDFRWRLEHQDTGWYPSARLFRQAGFLDWSDVVAEVAGALKTFAPTDAARIDAAEQEGGKALAAFRRSRQMEELRNRSTGLVAEGRLEEALNLSRQATARQPNYAEAHYDVGLILSKLDRFEEAVKVFRRVLALLPNHVGALNEMGGCLRMLGRREEALEALEKARAQQPDQAEIHGNIGNVLQDLGRFEEAREMFSKAAELAPDLADAHWNLSLLNIRTGRYAEGWALYEWRWKRAELLSEKIEFMAPNWLAETDLKGKTVLLRNEQGFGDTLQMLRYVPLLAARGAKVVLSVQPPLVEIARGVEGAAEVVPDTEPAPPHDYRCMMMSMPFAFGTTVETVPDNVPYVHVSPQARETWAARLGSDRARMRVGLAWSGNPAQASDRNRSMPFDALRALLDLDVEFYSLQVNYRPGELEALEADGRITSFHKDINSFMDTAALVEQLDLVIAVDTSVSHLSGAMGKRLWLMLAHRPDYRWHTGREDSPWYPTARLFLQPDYGDWAGVIARIRTQLGEVIGAA